MAGKPLTTPGNRRRVPAMDGKRVSKWCRFIFSATIPPRTAMTYGTLEGVLHPDGQVALPLAALSNHPARVMVTILESAEDAPLSELGDYLKPLTNYEERLARGAISQPGSAAR